MAKCQEEEYELVKEKRRMSLPDLNIPHRPRTDARLLIRPKAQCVVCHRAYSRESSNQRTCSKLCRDSLAGAKRRVLRLRAKGAYQALSTRDMELPKVKCIICGTKFEQRQSSYIVCGDPKCLKERARRKYKAWYKESRGK